MLPRVQFGSIKMPRVLLRRHRTWQIETIDTPLGSAFVIFMSVLAQKRGIMLNRYNSSNFMLPGSANLCFKLHAALCHALREELKNSIPKPGITNV
jgi:hypothetical protein